jgi:hypothetical protein
MLEVTRKSILSGKTNTMALDITQESLDIYDTIGGMLVQNVFPNLNKEEREFLINGVTPDEWNKYIGDFNDEE